VVLVDWRPPWCLSCLIDVISSLCGELVLFVGVVLGRSLFIGVCMLLCFIVSVAFGVFFFRRFYFYLV
jgi:hypothetical protein